MTRRTAMLGLLALGAAFAAGGCMQSSAPRVPRIAFASNRNVAEGQPFLASFVAGMQELGYVEKRDYQLDVRYADDDPARIRPIIEESVASRPDILIVSGLFAARIARDATTTIPTVVATGSDLVDAGIVRSYTHPGGNITGISDLTDETAVKRLELLHSALPNAVRVALLTNPDFPATPKIERMVASAARALGMTIVSVHATDRASLFAAVDTLATAKPDAVLASGDNNTVANAKELIGRVAALRIPIAYFWPGTAEMGALFSYQADILYNFKRSAWYVDRILKGTKPGDLPIELPKRYELVVNLRIARDLGLTIPAEFLLRTDRKIE